MYNVLKTKQDTNNKANSLYIMMVYILVLEHLQSYSAQKILNIKHFNQNKSSSESDKISKIYLQHFTS